MSKLRWSVGALAMALAVGICGQSNASITSITTTPASTGSFSWDRPADYVSLANGADLNSATISQGLPNPTGLGNHTTVLSEMVTPQTGSTYGLPNDHGFIVNNIMMFATGGATGIVNTMHLYDITNAITYTGPVGENPLNHPGNVTTYSINGLTDMLGGGAGDSFAWNPGNSSGNVWYTVFTLDDAPILQLNHTYALEIWSDQSQAGGSSSNFVWQRGINVPTDPGGMMMATGNASAFSTRTTIALAGLSGGSPRTATLAFNVAVPEPTTIVLLGLAGPALAWVTRRARARCHCWPGTVRRR